MAAEGARVVVADVQGRRGTVAAIEAAGGQALAVACDVADPAQVAGGGGRRPSSAFGALDVLVNDAGHLRRLGARCTSSTSRTWLRTVAVNLTGPFLCVRAAMPHLLASGRGPGGQHRLDVRGRRRAAGRRATAPRRAAWST